MKLVVAPSIWLAHFIAVYVLVSLVCSLQVSALALFGIAIVPLGIALATLAALAALGGIAFVDFLNWRRLRAGPNAFSALTSTLLCGLGVIGVLWVAFPAFVLAPCSA